MSSSALAKSGEMPRLVDSNNCVVPFIETRPENLRDERIKRHNQNIPDELLVSLKQADHPKEYIGPKRVGGKPVIPAIVRKTDSAWNYEKQRDKLKFLLEQPVCSCGAGKDISFIYDCSLHKPEAKPITSKYDLSAVRAEEPIKEEAIEIPDTLIPEEYHVIKNQGVWPLKIEDNRNTAITEEHLKHTTVFPSLKPAGRAEVIQLKHTMDALLKRVGVDETETKGPTQLHNLLEIIKQEQDIYNIVFHEVIRQVTIECKERGEVLSKLRERYANLLSRVPREIKSLHEEVIAQRALDRRLTEELLTFKNKIALLTDELAKLKEHDKYIGEQADMYQKDLKKALADAKNNASLLEQYHELYELQRKRLEKTIESLTDERELWMKASYSISLKVLYENRLSTAKQLNVASQSWYKLGKEISLHVCDRDLKDLTQVQNYVEEWKERLFEIRTQVHEKESVTKKTFQDLHAGLTQLRTLLNTDTFDKYGKLVQSPNKQKIAMIYGQVKKLIRISMKEMENYSGDGVIANEENLKKSERIVFSLLKMCNRLTVRHDLDKLKTKKAEGLLHYDELEKNTKNLCEQYRNRMSGDNGVANNMILFNNGLEIWQQRLELAAASSGGGGEKATKSENNKLKLTDADWLVFYQSFDEWFEYLKRGLMSVGNPLKDLDDTKPGGSKSNDAIDHDDLCNDMNKWMTLFCQYIDSQDSLIIDNVNIFNKKMLNWMLHLLIRLAPDQEDISEEAKKIVYENTPDVETLEKMASALIDQVDQFTNYLSHLASVVFNDEEKDRIPGEPSQLEPSLAGLKEFQNYYLDWAHVVKMLCVEMKTERQVSPRVQRRRTRPELRGGELDALDEEIDGHGKSYGEMTSEEERPNDEEDDDEEEGEDLNDDEDDDELTNVDSSSLLLPQQQQQQDSSSEQQNSMVVMSENVLGDEEKKEEEKSGTPFEVIGPDTNTERKFLENLNLEDSNHLTEAELKTTVFNAQRTIETLQTDLVATEQRAQKSEEKVAELELQLKDLLERLRVFENANANPVEQQQAAASANPVVAEENEQNKSNSN